MARGISPEGYSSRVGHVSKVRDSVSSARKTEDVDRDTMRNLAYVVTSANENITTLTKTVKQQEKEIAEKTDQAAALQRNYETLSRIRQTDQKDFAVMKKLKEEQAMQLQAVQEALEAETSKVASLEAQVREAATASSQLQQLRLTLQEVERERDERGNDAAQAKRTAAELAESNKALKINLDKLSRVQHEMLQRSRKADELTKQLQGEKEAAERIQHSTGSKLAVQERQLRTFLEANEALENDLREQMARVAQLERRNQEQEAEKQTIEAYYEARLEEMQAQYDRLLADVECAKQAAKAEVYRTFDDNSAVVPADDVPKAPA